MAQKEKERINAARKEREQPAVESGRPGSPKVHRFDESSGLPVYKFYDLGMKQDDGGTKNCPFDCWCCF